MLSPVTARVARSLLFGIELGPLPSPAQAFKQHSDITPQRGSEAQLTYIHLPGSPHTYRIPIVSILPAQGHRGNLIGSTNSWRTLETLQKQPWLVWLSGLSAGLRTKGSPVWFPVRAHAWVAGQVPSGGAQEANTR